VLSRGDWSTTRAVRARYRGTTAEALISTCSGRSYEIRHAPVAASDSRRGGAASGDRRVERDEDSVPPRQDGRPPVRGTGRPDRRTPSVSYDGTSLTYDSSTAREPAAATCVSGDHRGSLVAICMERSTISSVCWGLAGGRTYPWTRTTRAALALAGRRQGRVLITNGRTRTTPRASGETICSIARGPPSHRSPKRRSSGTARGGLAYVSTPPATASRRGVHPHRNTARLERLL